MDMEGALLARVVAAGTVAGSRVYWDERPQGAALPDVTLSLAPSARDQHYGGFQVGRETDVQIDVRAATFAQKKQLKEQVIAAVVPKAAASNGINFDRATDIRERPLNERTETLFIYRDVVEITVWYSLA